MMLKTHVAFGFFLSLLIIKNINLTNPLLFMVITISAAIIPDIDHLSSFVSKKLELLSGVLTLFFKHRGVLHSFFVIFIVSFLIYLKNQEVAIATLTGYSSHVILDALTKKGVRPFYPLKTKIKGFFKTNSLLENILFLIIIAAIIYQLLL